jgi:hypothetical protein
VHHDGLVLKRNGKPKGNLLHATQMNSIRVQLLNACPDAGDSSGS